MSYSIYEKKTILFCHKINERLPLSPSPLLIPNKVTLVLSQIIQKENVSGWKKLPPPKKNPFWRIIGVILLVYLKFISIWKVDKNTIVGNSSKTSILHYCLHNHIVWFTTTSSILLWNQRPLKSETPKIKSLPSASRIT